MTEASHADIAVPSRRNARREDGIIYKGMAGVVFALVASLVVLRFTLKAEEGAFAALFVLAMLLFDVGWDFAMRASGHGDMLESTATAAILAKGLRRWAYAAAIMMAVGYVQQDASRFKYVIICLVAWWAAEVLAKRAER